MAFISLKVDEKGRIQLPKDLRDRLGIEGDVLVETKEQSLEIKARKKIKDPLAFLASLNIETDKSPAEMKKEAQQAMMDSV